MSIIGSCNSAFSMNAMLTQDGVSLVWSLSSPLRDVESTAAEIQPRWIIQKRTVQVFPRRRCGLRQSDLPSSISRTIDQQSASSTDFSFDPRTLRVHASTRASPPLRLVGRDQEHLSPGQPFPAPEGSRPFRFSPQIRASNRFLHERDLTKFEVSRCSNLPVCRVLEDRYMFLHVECLWAQGRLDPEFFGTRHGRGQQAVASDGDGLPS